MKLGTKSLLYGAHQFLLHPLFVALAWWKLFGFPFDPRLWVAFFLHDIGYWGSPEMDGPVGQRHPERGARIMAWLFGEEWGSFTRRHSRSYAKLEGLSVSPLCAADKLATALVPMWLYVLQVILTDEAKEYVLLNSDSNAYEPGDIEGWARFVQAHFRSEAFRLAAEVVLGRISP